MNAVNKGVGSLFRCGDDLFSRIVLTKKTPDPLRYGRSIALVLIAVLCQSVSAEVRLERDIVFGSVDDVLLKLNLARPELPAARVPAVICIHGGGFSGGTRDGWNDFVVELAENGYFAMTIDYRLSPQHQWPAHIHDCKAAVRWLRAHADEYQVDTNRIGVMGRSAGGHLAQFMAVTNDVAEFDGNHTHLDQSSRVTCCAAWSQASDFTREYGIWKQAGEAFRGFLGADLTVKTRRQHIRASPLFWVTPNAAASLLIHGTEDQDVLFAQSAWMYERLKSAEVDTELVPIPGGPHGLTGDHLRQAKDATLAFFAIRLRSEAMKNHHKT